VKTEDPAAERRTSRRYDIELGLTYKTLDPNGVVRLAAGKTINMSSGGVLFQAEGELSAGAPIALSIRWPAPWPAERQVRLIIMGQIERCGSIGIAVSTKRHEFHSQKTEALADWEKTEEWATPFLHGPRKLTAPRSRANSRRLEKQDSQAT
jgi:hypothetical protein